MTPMFINEPVEAEATTRAWSVFPHPVVVDISCFPSRKCVKVPPNVFTDMRHKNREILEVLQTCQTTGR